MRKVCFSLVILFNVLVVNTSTAKDIVVEFSATAVQKIPEQPEYLTRMYVSENIVRKDSISNNIKTIEIMNSKDQIRLLLIPEEKVYMQQTSSNPQLLVAPEETTVVKPCNGMKDTSCVMLAEEVINGRKAEKWEFTVKQDEQFHRSLHWVDITHRIPIKEFFPDGTVMELVPQGTEQINNRDAEKWLWQLSGPNGDMRSSTQWFDPELKMMVREEIQGGYIRELRDIKVGKQDIKLFEVPDGYKQVDSLKNYFNSQQLNNKPTN